jgi:hypothetical protein
MRADALLAVAVSGFGLLPRGVDRSPTGVVHLV